MRAFPVRGITSSAIGQRNCKGHRGAIQLRQVNAHSKPRHGVGVEIFKDTADPGRTDYELVVNQKAGICGPSADDGRSRKQCKLNSGKKSGCMHKRWRGEVGNAKGPAECN